MQNIFDSYDLGNPHPVEMRNVASRMSFVILFVLHVSTTCIPQNAGCEEDWINFVVLRFRTPHLAKCGMRVTKWLIKFWFYVLIPHPTKSNIDRSFHPHPTSWVISHEVYICWSYSQFLHCFYYCNLLLWVNLPLDFYQAILPAFTPVSGWLSSRLFKFELFTVVSS